MKQQLSEALAWYADMTYLDEKDAPMVAAARLVERLLPGECEHGRTEPHDYADPSFPQAGWHIIHCDGQVWDEGIVEAVAAELKLRRELFTVNYQRDARAVLSALVELLTEKAK